MSSFKQPTRNEVSSPEILQLAKNWKERPGLILLETLNTSPSGLSLVAADPEEEVSGTDWELLEKVFSRRQRTQKLEEGAAIGFVRYDGSFHFGFYPQITVSHQSPPLLPPRSSLNISFSSDMEGATFIGLVERAQEYIAAGDIYQVCLAHRFRAKFEGDFWEYYAALRHVSPAPYSAFLRLGEDEVASSSPECFLNIQNQHIRTRPIKGTRPRHSNPQRDSELAAELVASEKERAELLMITDLERNDVGKVCKPGSIHVPDLLRLETYPQVFHLVSTVEGELRDDVSHIQALKACFPGGSITGAPKKRAMEIIAELEPVPRGLYTGAIGFFGYNGESRFNIAIRTAIKKGDAVSFHVGAGIVADSNPQAEWEETLHKARGLFLGALSEGNQNISKQYEMLKASYRKGVPVPSY
ncbi:MAG: aminodeoxychorismate synthase, component I [Verrucomicrobia bacterium]|nr:MAG: aminodeoxychorismate synthase, component I [Verrucomicrobiota bacterium]